MNELDPILQTPQYLQALLYGVWLHTHRKHHRKVRTLLQSKDIANIELGLALAYSLGLELKQLDLSFKRLEEVPTYLPMLNNLKSLGIGSNYLKLGDLDFLEDFKDLEELSLTGIN